MLAKRCRIDLKKRRRTTYVIVSAISWSPKTSDWIPHSPDATSNCSISTNLNGVAQPRQQIC
ncbi:hypothetical protein F511_44322 [Dorcoceras hygrometricum]|uniref:Uncharacterized protein n=1 Tax=Dorcoceras hygrometricum TaxID=472368 RepID=A0A2Z7BSZ2_9LAMI|nr:hypothetical protein F511_44322 [Dorcoceras hygrometricum]